MTIVIGEEGMSNLEKWGYCAAWNDKTEDTELVMIEGTDVLNPKRRDK